jgi:hypothetical protein
MGPAMAASVMPITSHPNAICAQARGLLPKEWSKNSLYAAVRRYGPADSRALMRLFATTSAEALWSLELAQPHNWQLTEPLRSPCLTALERFSNTRALSSGVQGDFFLRKKPLGILLSV